MAMEIDEGGARRLAVPLGSPARGTALTRILALKGSPGWLVDATSIREWRFLGVAERGGQTALFGPWLSGRPLSEVARMPPAAALPFLSRLADALLLLKERRVTLFPIQTDAVLFSTDGSVLFLPPEVMRELRGLTTFEANLTTFEALCNPDLHGEDLLSFGLGALTHRVITGEFPFTGTSAEDLHEQMRKLEIPAPAWRVPGLAPEVSEMVMAGLGRSRARCPPLEEWARGLREWQAADTIRELPAAERESLAASAESKRRVSEKRFRRRVFWEKNWKTALIIAVVIAVVGAGLASILKNVLAPRITRGYSPARVVETFYTSMNSLDHMAMSACVVGKAGQGEINETMNLYVISRVTTGYEGRSNVVAADQWDKAGRPKLAAPQTLFGVTGLTIRQESGEPLPVFLVSYEKWTPAPGGSEPAAGTAPAAPRSEGHAATDRVSLKKDRGDWVIYKIDRLRWDALPSP